MDLLCFSVLCLLCLCERLFICALWSPAWKGLTSWLSFVVYNCEFVHHIYCSIKYINQDDLSYFIGDEDKRKTDEKKYKQIDSRIEEK